MRKKLLPSLLFLLIIVSACKNDKKSVIGKWHFTEIKMRDIPEDTRKEYLNIATMEFTKDANFIFTTSSRKQTGTYSYNEKAKTLVTTVEHGSTDSLKVEWVGGNLMLSQKDESMTLKRE